jgi:hypothetical protein
VTTSTINNVANIFAAPTEAFRALKERPTFLLPLLVMLLGTCALIMWYYSSVDIAWFYETNLEAAGTEMPPEAQENLIEQLSRTPPMVIGAFAAASSSLIVLLILLLMAAYLSVLSLMTNDGYKFKYWFSLVCWASFPIVLGTLASMVNLAVSDVTFLPAQQINPLSFSSLLGLDVTRTDFLSRVMQSTDVTSLWALVLMTLGYSQWTGKSIGTAALIVTAPLLIILAIAFALSSF